MRCPKCLAPGSVLLDQSIRGEFILLYWCCHECSEAWSLTADDYVTERRVSDPDRRRL